MAPYLALLRRSTSEYGSYEPEKPQRKEQKHWNGSFVKSDVQSSPIQQNQDKIIGCLILHAQPHDR
jgi:hypothetical protein